MKILHTFKFKFEYHQWFFYTQVRATSLCIIMYFKITQKTLIRMYVCAHTHTYTHILSLLHTYIHIYAHTNKQRNPKFQNIFSNTFPQFQFFFSSKLFFISFCSLNFSYEISIVFIVLTYSHILTLLILLLLRLPSTIINFLFHGSCGWCHLSFSFLFSQKVY